MLFTLAQSTEILTESIRANGLNKVLEMLLNSLLKLEITGWRII